MRTFDYSPFYRASVGFDRIFDLLDSVSSQSGANGYPPYNIERLGENEYRITMAVSGFGESDLEIEVKEDTLLIRGGRAGEEQPRDYLY